MAGYFLTANRLHFRAWKRDVCWKLLQCREQVLTEQRRVQPGENCQSGVPMNEAIVFSPFGEQCEWPLARKLARCDPQHQRPAIDLRAIAEDGPVDLGGLAADSGPGTDGPSIPNPPTRSN